jgi:folate-binding protein YgfZ
MIETGWYYPVPEPGLLEVSGRDRVSFIQRQTTNDVTALREDEVMVNVLASPEGRILDVLRMIAAPGSLFMICLPGRAEKTSLFLKSRVFFMDQVALANLSPANSLVELNAFAASALQEYLALSRLPGAGEVLRLRYEQEETWLVWNGPPVGQGYFLLYPAQAGPKWTVVFSQIGLARLNPQEHEQMRIEQGIPGEQAEWVTAFTPLEVGLEAYVSLSKGCYTGQEVLARQVNYDRVTQKLTGLRLPQPATPGDRVWDHQRPIGTVTSAVHSPRLGEIALAVVRRPHNQPGSPVAVGADSQNLLPAITSELPFPPAPL